MSIDLGSIRSQFPIVKISTYLDHAFVGPLTKDAMKAINNATSMQAKGASKTFSDLISSCEQVRQEFADFLGATPSEVAFMDTTSMTLSVIANGLPLKEGDNVVVPEIEYLSNIYPWLNLNAKGIQTIRVKCRDRQFVADDLIRACNQRTKVLALSWVQFSNGYKADVEKIGEFCRSKKIYFVVDGNHAVGAFKINLKNLPIDILATQSFKWLCGPYNVAWLYVRREIIDKIKPCLAGPLSTIPAESFLDRKFKFKKDAGRFETGVFNFPGIIGLGASLRFFKKVGITNIEKRIIHLTDYISEGLQTKGYRVISKRNSIKEKSGIIIFRHLNPEKDFKSGKKDNIKRANGLDRRGNDPFHSSILDNLYRQNIIISMREGALRISPHFYNTVEEIDKFLKYLP